MRSCILVFYIALFCLPVSALGQTGDPDTLYAQRSTVARAKDAVAIWEARLAAGTSAFESAWKIARATYWLGGHDTTEAARRAAFEHGIEVARRAAALEPQRPEGHFWIAANMGGLAESFGLRQGLKYRGPIKDELETVLKIDPGYLQGSADRALGRWYHKVPGLFGGDKKKAEAHLRKSLTYNPTSAASHYFLAETLFELDKDNDARDELRKVIAGPIDPEWEPEDLEFKKQAEALLARKR